MSAVFLPEDGPSTVGPVSLPDGRRRYTVDDEELVAWVTVEPMPDAGLAWLALSSVRAQTGLIPVLLETILQVLAERPPQSLEAATQLAAEFYAFADEIDNEAAYTVTSSATRLVGSPIWTFWWD